jgi:UDP-galactopyranose mutase
MPLPSVLCFSHLRWPDALDRPQQLMLRCAREHRVFFIEEPVIDSTYAEITRLAPNLWRVVPHLAEGYGDEELQALWRGQLALLRAEHRIDWPILWFYTPAAVSVCQGLASSLVVYDCMYNLTEQHETAVPGLLALERSLVRRADVVLTCNRTLHEIKCAEHGNVHEVPDGIDLALFARARVRRVVPDDQAGIPGPRIGYAGRIDQRLDLALLDQLAAARPAWHFVLLGAVAPELSQALPHRDNIHYLGPKSRDEVPEYVTDWDASVLPLRLSGGSSTSITRMVLQHLAAGKPVVASPLPELLDPYAELGLVRVAEHVDQFVTELEATLAGDESCSPTQRDALLAQASWDGVWARVGGLIRDAAGTRELRPSVIPATSRSEQPRPQ